MTYRAPTRSLPPDLAELPPVSSIDGVARFLGVHYRSVRRWIDAGELRAVHAGARPRILRSDVAAFLQRGAAEASR